MNIKQKIITSAIILVLTFCLVGTFKAQKVEETYAYAFNATTTATTTIYLPLASLKEEQTLVVPPFMTPNNTNNENAEVFEEETIIHFPSKICNYSSSILVPISVRDRIEIEEYLSTIEEDLIILAKIIYREARGIKITAHKAAVVWCVLNRVDAGYGKTIKEVATQKYQFAWNPNTPVWEELYELARDVVIRWLLEKRTSYEVGRVLPKNYLFFAGNGKLNRFRTGYRTKDYWDWSLKSPYIGD